MLRKWTATILIFTANILLLAHNIVPHHHHNGLPHFEWFSFHQHDANHECDGCCCHHDDDGGTCLFEQNIDAVYETEDDHSHAMCTTHHNHDSGIFLQAVLLTFTYDFSLDSEKIPLPEPPYLINYGLDYAGSGLGLRAPPIERI
jgi:hypothetical protein